MAGTQIVQILKGPSGVPRPIARDWSCSQTGDCCRVVSAVTMTREEAILLSNEAERLKIEVTWMEQGGGPFVSIKAAPCPFLGDEEGGKALCRVYGVRPYNCRRWGCLRPNPRTEPLEPDHGFLGTANTRERVLGSRVARRAFDLLQRRAQKWAVRHGWTMDRAVGTPGGTAPWRRAWSGRDVPGGQGPEG